MHNRINNYKNQLYKQSGSFFKMAILPDIVLDILAKPDSITMLSTVDEKGKPNVVIISTVAVIDLETIAFADMCLNQTKKNLKKTGKLTITVTDSQNKAYQIQCTFIHFDTKTPLFDRWHTAVWNKMKVQFRGVALAKVENVSSANL